ncbi:hypothetical protein GCM10010497_55810 [Streptomyces cinereoruber]|uniref:Uncharacterized protein n=1 Tax=Streptomyces cinereoruber TaxID=67260 RepID=A0AAV4KQP5_9ACTN|nr:MULTISPECIES: hypothetical protein [Streptomyces]AVH96724.1 hypothetical protein C5L38_18000 [Streptomyces sp. WAC00288]KYG55352.1 hypothetical protein AWI43_13695 [Streptomyces sp. WAC04657]MBB4161430.1 hypothetical protein [Streptomyces cinereoruber]MBY8818500.1 hypothetical protein [Streptomyces cinereoruber]NIH60726.1 hypothetical protein [Streptomyces cinereoruber]
MRRRHHFHIDHLGHSVSVTVETGHSAVVDVLVDGKETARVTIGHDRQVALPVELPTDPPTTVTVRVTSGPGVPRCLLVPADEGDPLVMAPRSY